MKNLGWVCIQWFNGRGKNWIIFNFLLLFFILLSDWNKGQNISCSFLSAGFLINFRLFHSSEKSSGWWKYWNKSINWSKWKSDFEIFDFCWFIALSIDSNGFRVNITSNDFFIFSIVEDNFTAFEKYAGFSGDFVIRSKESFEIGFVDCKLIFGTVLESKWISWCNVKKNRRFLSNGSAVSFTFDDEIDNGWYSGWHIRIKYKLSYKALSIDLNIQIKSILFILKA